MTDHPETPTPVGPRTEAGRKLDHAWPGNHLDRLQWHEAIAAIEAEATRDGLRLAQRRLSEGGLHDGKCPEPDEPCICGIDDAIFDLVGTDERPPALIEEFR